MSALGQSSRNSRRPAPFPLMMNRLIAVSLVLLVACAQPAPVTEPAPGPVAGIGQLAAERAALLSRNEQLASEALSRQRLIEQLDEEVSTLDGEVEAHERELARLEEEIEDLTAERRELNAERGALQREVREARAERDALNDAPAPQPVAAAAPSTAATRSHPGRCVINPDQGDIVCETSTGHYVCRGSASPACGTRSFKDTANGCDQYWNGGRVCGPDRANQPAPSSTGASPSDARPATVTTQPSPNQNSHGVGANCTEERAHGHSNMGRSHPHYRPQFDGDNDGIACET